MAKKGEVNKKYYSPGGREGQGRLKFTYFAVEGSYPNAAGKAAGVQHAFYSVNELGQQLWVNNREDDLSQEYDGWVPHDILLAKLNDALFYGYHFEDLYLNWRFRYEQGYYYPGEYRSVKYKDAETGEFKYRKEVVRAPVNDVRNSQDGSRGNPPPNRENQAW